MKKTLMKAAVASALTVGTVGSSLVTVFAEEYETASIEKAKQTLEEAKAALEQAKQAVANA